MKSFFEIKYPSLTLMATEFRISYLPSKDRSILELASYNLTAILLTHQYNYDEDPVHSLFVERWGSRT